MNELYHPPTVNNFMVMSAIRDTIAASSSPWVRHGIPEGFRCDNCGGTFCHAATCGHYASLSRIAGYADVHGHATYPEGA